MKKILVFFLAAAALSKSDFARLAFSPPAVQIPKIPMTLSADPTPQGFPSPPAVQIPEIPMTLSADPTPQDLPSPLAVQIPKIPMTLSADPTPQDLPSPPAVQIPKIPMTLSADPTPQDLPSPPAVQIPKIPMTLSADPKKPPPNPWEDRNPYIPIPQRITVSHIEGNNFKCCFATNFTSLEILLGGEYVPGKFLPMIDIRGERFDDTTYAASAGIITRIVPKTNSTIPWMLGFNGFYDFRQGNLGYYNQVGFGLEILSKRWDFRGNVYVPFGAKRKMKQCVFDDFIGDFFAIQDIIESVSYSFNAEVGWLAINSKYILLYLAGGPYYLSGRKCSDKTRGGEFRIQPQYKDFIALNLSVSHDPLFSTVYQAEVLINLPLYLLSKKISKKETCGLTARQIYQPVVRFEVMPLGRCSCWTSNF